MDNSRILEEALMEKATENGWRKVLEGLCIDTENTISSKSPSFEETR